MKMWTTGKPCLRWWVLLTSRICKILAQSFVSSIPSRLGVWFADRSRSFASTCNGAVRIPSSAVELPFSPCAPWFPRANRLPHLCHAFTGTPLSNPPPHLPDPPAETPPRITPDLADNTATRAQHLAKPIASLAGQIRRSHDHETHCPDAPSPRPNPSLLSPCFVAKFVA